MAEFFIQLDKQSYFAGDTVNGYIYINVHTHLPQATGVSLKFTGYECVKWVEARELHRPRHDPNRPKNLPPPHDPIAAIPPHLLHKQHHERIQISDVQSEDDRSPDHRPQYIRTPSDRYFQMKFYETRNMFTKNKSMLYQCQGFAPGQYSFPFSFKTFEGWPASFEHITQKKKGVIIYHMTAAIEPGMGKMQLKYGQMITLRETRWLESKLIKKQGQITTCCCCSKGNCLAEVHFQKDGYMPGQLVQMMMEIDNTLCSADITSIWIKINFTVTMKSQGASTADHGNIFQKSLKGLLAGHSATGNDSIRQAFNLHSNKEIKPTCSGKLLSNLYTLSVRLSHDIMCECCSDVIVAEIPIIIFPVVKIYQMPNVFQNNWAPQVMPETNLALMNDFQNSHLNQMQQQYPQQQQQQQYPQQQQQQQYPQQQQVYPQQNEQTMQQFKS